MNQIVVKIEDKFINEAFQKWCFEKGITWNAGEVEPCYVERKGSILLSDAKRLTWTRQDNNYLLPQEWEEATTAILEMIKPKEKKWTDEDMIRFAGVFDTRGYSELTFRLELKNFK